MQLINEKNIKIELKDFVKEVNKEDIKVIELDIPDKYLFIYVNRGGNSFLIPSVDFEVNNKTITFLKPLSYKGCLAILSTDGSLFWFDSFV